MGRQIAFDAQKGRLWAICTQCGRWNLAPLEERWEPVEEAERLFRNTRDRIQHQNIGLCHVSGGTKLVRVGEALPDELAVWRYGRRLLSQRRKYLMTSGIASTAALLVWAGPQLGFPLAAAAAPFLTYYHYKSEWRKTEPVLTRIGPGELPDCDAFTVRATHMYGARLGLAADESGLTLHIEDVGLQRAFTHQRRQETGKTLVLPDPLARRVLRRGMVYLNRKGATEVQISAAVETLSATGGAAGYLQEKAKYRTPAAVLKEDVALEMALHEEEERQALTGELGILQAAWREAEEIATIADRLSDRTGE